MKVLLAEDDNLSRSILEHILSDLGYEVTACADGQAAWEAYDQERFHLVISDWSMPRLDGVELCNKIRKANKNYYSYFILQTSCSEKEALAKACSFGINDVLLKPFDQNDLAIRLRLAHRFLELETQRPSAPQSLPAIERL